MNCELKGSPWESIRLFFRLRVVPRLSSRIVERAKITPREKRRHAAGTRLGCFSSALVSLALLSLRKNWGLLDYEYFPWNVFISLLQSWCYSSWRSKSSSPRCLHSKGRTIRKVMGGGRGGIFKAQEFVFAPCLWGRFARRNVCDQEPITRSEQLPIY